jgi:hypothetical protein
MRCPRGDLALLHNIRSIKGNGDCYGIYRIPKGICRDCEQRSGCTNSTSPTYQRDFAVKLPAWALADRESLLAIAHGQAMPAGTRPPARPKAPPAQRWMPETPTVPGHLRAAAPCLRPGQLVAMWRAQQQRFAIEVRVTAERKPPPTRPWVAATLAARQARRRTWADRARYNEFRGSVTVIRHPQVTDAA